MERLHKNPVAHESFTNSFIIASQHSSYIFFVQTNVFLIILDLGIL